MLFIIAYVCLKTSIYHTCKVICIMYLEPCLSIPHLLGHLLLPLKSPVVPSLREVAWGSLGQKFWCRLSWAPLLANTGHRASKNQGCVTRNIFNLQAFLLAGCLMKTCPPELSTLGLSRNKSSLRLEFQHLILLFSFTVLPPSYAFQYNMPFPFASFWKKCI